MPTTTAPGTIGANDLAIAIQDLGASLAEGTRPLSRSIDDTELRVRARSVAAARVAITRALRRLDTTDRTVTSVIVWVRHPSTREMVKVPIAI